MSENRNQAIKVIVAIDFTDDIMEQLRAVSPRYIFERHHPKVPDHAWADAEVLYTLGRYPEPAQAPRLRWIQAHSAGLDRIAKLPIFKAEDVEITSTSGIHSIQITEFCLGMMLAFNYKVLDMLRFQADAIWPKDEREFFFPSELRGKTLGIVGYGSIGRELARVANTLGMTVLASKRDVMHTAEEGAYVIPGTGDPAGDIPARLYPPEALASMAAACDYLVVTTPLTEATYHSVNEDVLHAMKKTAVLINIGRGAVVDEAALISALAAGKIAGAALDVFEEEPLPPTSPLWNMDNVIISPHVSGNSVNYHQRAADLFAENLARYIENRPLLNRLNRKTGY